MKNRSLLALVGLVISFALPAFAEEQKTVEPEVRQQIEATVLKYEEAYNKYDAKALADFYTIDAIEVLAWEVAADAAIGRQAIEKKYAGIFVSSPRKMTHSLVQVYAIGNDICAISDLSHHYITHEGSYVAIYTHDADDWKIRMAFAN